MAPPLFSQANYLVRFDDICPTMDWSAWREIEAALIEEDVKPILAVVPDNKDLNLMVDPPDPDFWEKVRGWQARGWAIGLHGYQHVYVNSEPGILGLTPLSEFAGLSYLEQFEKLRLGLEIFTREGVHPDVFVAPAHSLDLTTVMALKALGIHALSDGFALSPYQDSTGSTWVPQQFAEMRAMPFGTWTFCYHMNHEPPHLLASLKRNLARYRLNMITLQEALAQGNRRRSSADLLLAGFRRMVTYLQKKRKVRS